MFLNKLKEIIFIIIYFSICIAQECPEIYVPPYGEKPRDCATTLGSTCLITCPDEFDIIGSCFRTCVMRNAQTSIQTTDFTSDLKLNKKRNRPFLFGLKPKRINFLPTSSINKLINTGKRPSCCNKKYNDDKEEFTQIVKFTKNKNDKLIDPQIHSISCPGRSLPEHHLLNSLAKLMKQEELDDEEISSRQNMANWSGDQPYCVNTDVICPELNSPTNGFFYYCPNYAGLICAIGCQSGYRLIGSRTLQCKIDGTWNDVVPTCQEI